MDGSDNRADGNEPGKPATQPKVADGLVIDFFGSGPKDTGAKSADPSSPPVLAESTQPENEETGFEIEFVDDEPMDHEDALFGKAEAPSTDKPSIDISGLLDIDMSDYVGNDTDGNKTAGAAAGGIIEFIDDEEDPPGLTAGDGDTQPLVIYAEGPAGETDPAPKPDSPVPPPAEGILEEPPASVLKRDRDDLASDAEDAIPENGLKIIVEEADEPAPDVESEDAEDKSATVERDVAETEGDEGGPALEETAPPTQSLQAEDPDSQTPDARAVEIDVVDPVETATALKDDVPEANDLQRVAPLAVPEKPAESPPARTAPANPVPSSGPRSPDAGTDATVAARPSDSGPATKAAVAPKPTEAAAPRKVDANELLRQAVALHSRGDLEEASTLYRRIIAAQPSMPGPWINLGVLLRRTGHLEPAVACLKRGVALQPEDGPAWSNLGNALRALSRLDASEAAHRQALECTPSAAQIHYNLALVLRDKGEFEEALESFKRAEMLGYNKAELPWDRAIAHLLQGNLEAGFQDYEARWKLPDAMARHQHIPVWKGSRLRNRTILVWSEQGMGDTLQFSRYITALAKLEPRGIGFEVQAPLVSLIKASPGFQKVAITPQGAPVPGYNFQVPLLSLPRLLKTTLESVPDRVPYLKPPADKQAPELPGERLKVGICWAGKPSHKNDRNRSLDLRQFGPLLEIEDATFYSLQKGPRARDIEALKIGPFLRDLSPAMGDFADSAAILRALDLVITVDTSIAHLAGALARPVWVLLPYAPDWRWMMHRDDSPWYPTMTLFRQTSPGDWREVFARARLRLLRNIQNRQ